MKSSIRTFILAAFAAASLTAFPHFASAESFAVSVEYGSHTLPQGGLASVNVITLPNAGTYIIGGQESALAYTTTEAQPVICYTSAQAGGTTPLVDGPSSFTTIQAPGGYVTIPLNGYYVATAPTNIWVVCRYYGQGVVATFNGTITATQVK
jgi:hypothetical protein